MWFTVGDGLPDEGVQDDQTGSLRFCQGEARLYHAQLCLLETAWNIRGHTTGKVSLHLNYYYYYFYFYYTWTINTANFHTNTQGMAETEIILKIFFLISEIFYSEQRFMIKRKTRVCMVRCFDSFSLCRYGVSVQAVVW